MEPFVVLIFVFVFWANCRLGDIRDELGRIRRLLEEMKEGEA